MELDVQEKKPDNRRMNIIDILSIYNILYYIIYIIYKNLHKQTINLE